jgi:hypothetical protein
MEGNGPLLVYNKLSGLELFVMNLHVQVCYCGWNLSWYLICYVLEWSLIYLY